MKKALYRSRDDVNRFVAADLAAQHGIKLDSVSQIDGHHDYDVAICDFDSFVESQSALLDELLRPTCQLVVVHSYSLDEREVTRLQSNGVLVRRRLDCDLFTTIADSRAA